MKSLWSYPTAVLALMVPAWASDADVVVLPSGTQAYLQEVLWDRPGSGLVYRFRFVASDFSVSETEFDALQADLEHLCTAFALPRLSNVGPVPAQIIISLADRESEFGTIDPDVVQVFEAYRVQDGACMWEIF